MGGQEKLQFEFTLQKREVKEYLKSQRRADIFLFFCVTDILVVIMFLLVLGRKQNMDGMSISVILLYWFGVFPLHFINYRVKQKMLSQSQLRQPCRIVFYEDYWTAQSSWNEWTWGYKNISKWKETPYLFVLVVGETPTMTTIIPKRVMSAEEEKSLRVLLSERAIKNRAEASHAFYYSHEPTYLPDKQVHRAANFYGSAIEYGTRKSEQIYQTIIRQSRWGYVLFAAFVLFCIVFLVESTMVFVLLLCLLFLFLFLALYLEPIWNLRNAVYVYRNKTVYRDLLYRYQKKRRFRRWVKNMEAIDLLGGPIGWGAEILIQTRPYDETETYLQEFREKFGERPEWYVLQLKYLFRKKNREEFGRVYEEFQEVRKKYPSAGSKSWNMADLMAELMDLDVQTPLDFPFFLRLRFERKLTAYYWCGLFSIHQGKTRQGIRMLRYFVKRGNGYWDEQDANEVLEEYQVAIPDTYPRLRAKARSFVLWGAILMWSTLPLAVVFVLLFA